MIEPVVETPNTNESPDCQAALNAIIAALQSDRATQDPMNALVVWTELGRGLAGTLDRKGADVGLLGRIVGDYAAKAGTTPVQISDWVYCVPPERRLTRDDLARTLRTVQTAVDRVISPAVAALGDDGGRAAFLIVVRAWYFAGLAILRSLPGRSQAPDADLVGALGAWCARYLPRDASGPGDLGVRMTRSPD